MLKMCVALVVCDYFRRAGVKGAGVLHQDFLEIDFLVVFDKGE